MPGALATRRRRKTTKRSRRGHAQGKPSIRPALADFPIELDSGAMNIGGKVQTGTSAPAAPPAE